MLHWLPSSASQGDAPVFILGTRLEVDYPLRLAGKVISSEEVVPRPLLPDCFSGGPSTGLVARTSPGLWLPAFVGFGAVESEVLLGLQKFWVPVVRTGKSSVGREKGSQVDWTG